MADRRQRIDELPERQKALLWAAINDMNKKLLEVADNYGPEAAFNALVELFVRQVNSQHPSVREVVLQDLNLHIDARVSH